MPWPTGTRTWGTYADQGFLPQDQYAGVFRYIKHTILLPSDQYTGVFGERVCWDHVQIIMSSASPPFLPGLPPFFVFSFSIAIGRVSSHRWQSAQKTSVMSRLGISPIRTWDLWTKFWCAPHSPCLCVDLCIDDLSRGPLQNGSIPVLKVCHLKGLSHQIFRVYFGLVGKA